MILAQLISEIEDAFADIKRGNGITLHETDVIDSCGSEMDRAKARKCDMDQRWQDVPDKEIEYHPSALCFLDLPGFRYYLPAYLRWSLKFYKSSSSFTVDSTIYALCPSNKGVTDRHRDKWAIFNQRQSFLILAFLKFMVESGDGRVDTFMADIAINSYWRQFSQPTTPPYSEPVSRSPQR